MCLQRNCCVVYRHIFYLVSEFYKRNLPFFYMIKYEISCLKNTIFYPSINRKIRSTYSSYFFIHLFFNPPFLSKNIYLYFTRHLSLHFHPSSSSSSVCNICLSLSLSLSLSLDSPLIWFLFHSASLYFTLNHLLESRKFESGSKINEKSSALDSAFSSKSCSIL